MPTIDMRESPLSGERLEPLVSVVVPAHNAAAHLEETCLSALSQTYRALELIVVDDGSTDGTVDMASRIAASDPRVRLIRLPNGGVAAARNAGVKAARGEFIAPLDSDDLWDSTKIARQVQRFQECGPRTGVVYTWWAWLDSDGRLIDHSPRWRVEGRVLDRLLEINFTGCASVPMFRRTCIEEAGGYDASLRSRSCEGCEDWDLALRVAERHEVAVTPAVLVGYRRRPGSMSTATDTMWQSQLAVTEAAAARQPSLRGHALRRSRGQFALHLAGVSFWSKRYWSALRWGVRARPISLVLAILPYVVRLIVASFFGVRTRAVVQWPRDSNIDDVDLRSALIPYDLIYNRHWKQHDAPAGAGLGQPPEIGRPGPQTPSQIEQGHERTG